MFTFSEESRNKKGSVPMKAKEPATPSVLKRRVRQKRCYERKKLSLKKEDIERRRIAREDREARRAERKRQAELRASEDAASLPAPRLDKTAEWNAGFLACYLTMKPCIEEREGEIRELRAGRA